MRKNGATLSAREIECLVWFAEGMQDQTIAARLGVSKRTVRFHFTNVKSALRASNRTHALVLALRLGLVDLHLKPGAPRPRHLAAPAELEETA